MKISEISNQLRVRAKIRLNLKKRKGRNNKEIKYTGNKAHSSQTLMNWQFLMIMSQ